MSHVLVTGAAGFVGYHLSKSLADDGLNVIVADNFKRGKEDAEFTALVNRPNVKFLQLDLTDLSQVMKLPSEITQVYHLAAINGTENFYKIPDQVLRTNIESTLNILEWAKTRKNVKVVYTSSSEAYAGSVQANPSLVPTQENVPLTIDDVTNVRWSYGASKLLGECAMFAYGAVSPLKFSIVRYHNIYGPRMGNEHVVPQFLRRVFDGEVPLKVYGTTQTRAFCFVSDAVKATRMVMDREDAHAQIYHIGNQSEEIEIQDLAKRVLSTMKKPTEIIPMDAPAGSVVRRCPDTRKMQALGFTAEVQLAQGLALTAEWYVEDFKRRKDK